MISAHPTAPRRAICNIVDNAIKYGGSAMVTLLVEADHAVMIVEDEGPGIPRSDRDRVFESFYRGDNSRNPDTGGVGLGLSVTRSIIWEHGGEILLANRKGRGLTVRIDLPLGPGDDPLLHQPPTARQGAAEEINNGAGSGAGA